jgi:hypothetical protein
MLARVALGTIADPGLVPGLPRAAVPEGGAVITRCLVVDEDGYLIDVDNGRGGPVICWGLGSRLCCDSCAAFRIEPHRMDLDGDTGETGFADFVRCLALNHTIGRLVEDAPEAEIPG